MKKKDEKHLVVSEETHKKIRLLAAMADMTIRDYVAHLIKGK